MVNKQIKNGIIIKSIGGIYTVDALDTIIDVKPRGIFRKKNIAPCCGDRVTLTNDAGDFVIEKIEKRVNHIIRPPLSNIDQLVFVVSTSSPHPNFLLLDKFIAICRYKNIVPIIVITKIDLSGVEEIQDIYKNTDVRIFVVNNITGEGSREVAGLLKDKISAFTGNTGVGKTTLLNHILPHVFLKTGEISKKLGRGKHTTRHVELYKLDNGGYVADTPGFSTFETNKYHIILKEELANCFDEFDDYKDKCKFADCSHTREKGCAVIKAVDDGLISKSRFESYVTMYEEAKQIKEWEIK